MECSIRNWSNLISDIKLSKLIPNLCQRSYWHDKDLPQNLEGQLVVSRKPISRAMQFMLLQLKNIIENSQSKKTFARGLTSHIQKHSQPDCTKNNEKQCNILIDNSYHLVPRERLKSTRREQKEERRSNKKKLMLFIFF